MRTTAPAFGALFGVFFAMLAFPALAEDPQGGCTTPDALGVSRIIKIDATGGPWFGAPHGDADLLSPGEVVLTFDDGPAPKTTRPILAALAAQCTRATFFMVGEMAAEYPDVVREVIEQGHTAGTHTWSHLNLARLGPDVMKQQIEAAINAVEKSAGTKIAPFFRYPYLSDSPATVAYLKSRNIAQFAVDIDSLDWRKRNAQNAVHRVIANLGQHGRGIILMHDIHASTAAAVPLLLTELKAKGYRIVHLQPTVPVETLASFEPPSKLAHARAVHLRTAHRARFRVRGGESPTWMIW
jgi:peptidoglycan/xylan/chitin deacetylase (PgdA/CDA1 family)